MSPALRKVPNKKERSFHPQTFQMTTVKTTSRGQDICKCQMPPASSEALATSTPTLQTNWLLSRRTRLNSISMKLIKSQMPSWCRSTWWRDSCSSSTTIYTSCYTISHAVYTSSFQESIRMLLKDRMVRTFSGTSSLPKTSVSHLRTSRDSWMMLSPRRREKWLKCTLNLMATISSQLRSWILLLTSKERKTEGLRIWRSTHPWYSKSASLETKEPIELLILLKLTSIQVWRRKSIPQSP